MKTTISKQSRTLIEHDWRPRFSDYHGRVMDLRVCETLEKRSPQQSITCHFDFLPERLYISVTSRKSGCRFEQVAWRYHPTTPLGGRGGPSFRMFANKRRSESWRTNTTTAATRRHGCNLFSLEVFRRTPAHGAIRALRFVEVAQK
jgi:hypothetical protein